MSGFLSHWRSTLFGFLGAAFGGLAVYQHIDQLSGGDLALAIAACVAAALKSVVTADAKAVEK